MTEQQSVDGTGASDPVVQPSAPAPASQPSGISAAAESVVSEAEAEIKALLQKVHDKIVALGGETWLSDATAELREARNSVEAAAEWVAEHFHKSANA